VIGLEIRFLTGRFHGTAWNQAHNEGIPEWPPSPWRLLRALVSASYADDVAPSEVQPIIEKLRGLPRYRLPLATDAHVRHYMPDTRDAKHEKTKVFDAFVAIEGGAQEPAPVIVAWAVDLTHDQRATLARLCRRIAYVGRAESWSEVRVVDLEGDRWDCWPDDGGSAGGATNLLALSSAAALSKWLEQDLSAKGKGVPRTVWDVLTFDSARYRDEGWSGVPGTRLVRYAFKAPPFRRAVVPRPSRERARAPTVARYAIRSSVLPSLREAVALGERLRVAVMSQSKRISGDARPIFSGHELPSLGHRHAMYLPTSDIDSNATRSVVDHFLVAARDGFDDEDIVALQQLRRIWGRGGHDLELILTGLGSAEDFGGTKAPRCAAVARSTVWRSLTPFVPTRHPKIVRGLAVDTIETQVRRACEQLLGVAPVSVEPYGEPAHWLRFRRRRLDGAGRRGPDTAVGARLVFEEPVQGPVALGYGAHFGLGLFVAELGTV
jgi:CRISPR-associated protein Csb2